MGASPRVSRRSQRSPLRGFPYAWRCICACLSSTPAHGFREPSLRSADCYPHAHRSMWFLPCKQTQPRRPAAQRCPSLSPFGQFFSHSEPDSRPCTRRSVDHALRLSIAEPSFTSLRAENSLRSLRFPKPKARASYRILVNPRQARAVLQRRRVACTATDPLHSFNLQMPRLLHRPVIRLPQRLRSVNHKILDHRQCESLYEG